VPRPSPSSLRTPARTCPLACARCGLENLPSTERARRRQRLAPDRQLVRRLAADVASVEARARTAGHDDLPHLCTRKPQPRSHGASPRASTHAETLARLNHVQRAPARAAARVRASRGRASAFEVCSARAQQRGERSSDALAKAAGARRYLQALACQARQRVGQTRVQAAARLNERHGGPLVSGPALTCSLRRSTPYARGTAPPVRRYATRSPRPERRRELRRRLASSARPRTSHALSTSSSFVRLPCWYTTRAS